MMRLVFFLALASLTAVPANGQDTAEITSDVLLDVLTDDPESDSNCVLTDTESPLFWACVVPSAVAVATVVPGLIIESCKKGDGGVASRPGLPAEADVLARTAHQRRGVGLEPTPDRGTVRAVLPRLGTEAGAPAGAER